MNFEREDDREVAGDKRVTVDDRDAIRKQNAGGHSPAVRHNWPAISTIPAINLHATTTLCQCGNVRLSAGGAGYLATQKIGVVRA